MYNLKPPLPIRCYTVIHFQNMVKLINVQAERELMSVRNDFGDPEFSL